MKDSTQTPPLKVTVTAEEAAMDLAETPANNTMASSAVPAVPPCMNR